MKLSSIDVGRGNCVHSCLRNIRYYRASHVQPKTRQWTYEPYLVPPGLVSCHSDTPDMLYRSVVERVFLVKYPSGEFLPPPSPNPNAIIRLLDYRDKIVASCVPTPIWTEKQFLSGLVGRKRLMYDKAFLENDLWGTKQAHAQIKPFLKIEKTDFAAKPDAVPRLIQPRSTRYCAALGVYVKSAEHNLYEATSRVWGDTVITKAMNGHQIGELFKRKWDSYTDPAAFSLDAVRFDQHVSRLMLHYEHSFYKRVFNHDNELSRLLRMQLRNVAVRRENGWSISYMVDGCRMSGDMNTGLGNCLLMTAMMYECRSTYQHDWTIVNNGDDCVVIGNRAQVEKVHANVYKYFLPFGFQITPEPVVYDLERVVFCQMNPIWNGLSYIMCRNPFMAIRKDTVCKHKLNDNKYLGWLRAVSECGLALCPNVPILTAFYLCLQRVAKTSKARHYLIESGGLKWYSQGIRHQEIREPTQCARYSFWLAFGIVPTDQLLIEEFYRAPDVGCSLPNLF